MYYVNIPFTTDGSGNFSIVLSKSNIGQNPTENLIYEVAVNGANQYMAFSFRERTIRK